MNLAENSLFVLAPIRIKAFNPDTHTWKHAVRALTSGGQSNDMC